MNETSCKSNKKFSLSVSVSTLHAPKPNSCCIKENQKSEGDTFSAIVCITSSDFNKNEDTEDTHKIRLPNLVQIVVTQKTIDDGMGKLQLAGWEEIEKEKEKDQA